MRQNPFANVRFRRRSTRADRYERDVPVILFLLIWFLNHHLPVIEAGFALVYGSLAIFSWRNRRHAIAYAAAAVLAITLATCAALAH